MCLRNRGLCSTIARDKDTCWYIMHSQVRYLQLCDCNVTHVIYVIPLKYFKNSTVILIHAEKIVYWSKRIPNDYHFGNDCPCLRKLPMFSLSSIVTIRINLHWSTCLPPFDNRDKVPRANSLFSYKEFTHVHWY